MTKRLLSSFWHSYRRWLYGMLSGVIALSIVIGTPQPSPAVPWWEILMRGVQILQLSNISDEQEVALGGQINQQITAELWRNRTPISSHREATAYLNQIGQKLAAASDRPNIPYKFQIVEDRNINAFATMGGHVYINAGLMIAAENEAELASVVAHEIGHIVGGHALAQMRERAIQRGLLSVAGLDESAAVQIGVELALNLPNSREDELESDRLGLENMRRVGYSPSGMVSFMKKLQQRSGGSPPSILSTHPAVGDRIRVLEEQLQQNPPQSYEVGGLDSTAYRNKINSFAR